MEVGDTWQLIVLVALLALSSFFFCIRNSSNVIE